MFKKDDRLPHRFFLASKGLALSLEFDPQEKSYFFYDRGPYHIETSPLIFFANHCTGFL